LLPHYLSHGIESDEFDGVIGELKAFHEFVGRDVDITLGEETNTLLRNGRSVLVQGV